MCLLFYWTRALAKQFLAYFTTWHPELVLIYMSSNISEGVVYCWYWKWFNLSSFQLLLVSGNIRESTLHFSFLFFSFPALLSRSELLVLWRFSLNLMMKLFLNVPLYQLPSHWISFRPVTEDWSIWVFYVKCRGNVSFFCFTDRPQALPVCSSAAELLMTLHSQLLLGSAWSLFLPQ